MQRFSVMSLILPLLFLLAACDLQQNNPTMDASTSLPPTSTPGATVAAQSTPLFTVPVTTTTTPRTLIIWLPPEIASRTAVGADTFLDQVAEITAPLPDVEVRIEQKAVSGQGGMLSYLRTGRNVAPDILPDLIVLPTDQLTATFSDGLIYSLNGLLDEAALDELYPAAQAMAQPDTQIVGYPLALTNLSHLAFIPGSLGEDPILNWDNLLALENQRLLIAGAGRGGATLALQLYLDAGGSLVNEAGQPALQTGPLAQALEFFAQGRASGLIVSQSSSTVSVADAWQLYTSGATTMVQTTADHVLLALPAGQASNFAPLPGINGFLPPLVTGWAWALTAPDAGQQELAVGVMLALMDDGRLAEWSFQNKMLPTRQGAFALWPQKDAFSIFLERELAVARPFPSAANNTIMGILGNALVDVLSQAQTPQLAAEEAAATLQP